MNAQSFARLHQDQARSGISIAAFCRKRGIALSSYHYWRRRYGSTPGADGFVEVQISKPSHPAPASHSSPSTQSAVLERPIRLLYRGVHFILPIGFSPSSLRQCLDVLKEALPC